MLTSSHEAILATIDFIRNVMLNILNMSSRHALPLDLVELRALVTFVAERNVTRSARVLGFTQSGASHALRRLRARIDDPILVRSNAGMTPTPRALRLADLAEHVLAEMAQIQEELSPFEPARLRRTFRVAMDDNMALHLAPLLVGRISALAPMVSVEIVRPPESPREALSSTLDLLIDMRQSEDQGLYDRPIFVDELVVVVRRSHPRISERLSLDAFVAEGHVLVSTRLPARSLVDSWLEERGKRRTIVMKLPYFLAAMRVVSMTDLLLTTSRRLFDNVGQALSLLAFPCPAPIPAVKVHQTWHERVHRDAAHIWFREQVQETASMKMSVKSPPKKRR